ncbi:branched-chain amino acid ABC transporter, permease domain protein [Bordetella bronchiseptica D993]|uniref:ABC transporter permease subunit n=1 Tax=Bordetella bronchiseptica TaxID=518 RepID=UPI0004616492|nr:hypothetical protein [Bordetella bronchiseptica]KDB98485.1 branched-chain amino acid ABC transporter, permease domain protein [Bordetella bronchiseptica D993]
MSESLAIALRLIVSGDPVLMAIVGRSLAVSATACVLACLIGMAAGGWLGVARFRGRGIVLTLLNTSLALPSVVVGLAIYLLLSHSGPLGFLGWLFSFKAFAIIIIGGLGNIWGAIIAALIVGMTESLAGGFGSVVLQDALAFIIMILILLVRPLGLFGKGMRV